jgi:hypothetical protein
MNLFERNFEIARSNLSDGGYRKALWSAEEATLLRTICDLHFGLGAAATIDKLEVKSPDGTLENVSVRGCDRLLTIVEGKGVVNNPK